MIVVILGQDPVGITFGVVELTRLHRPDECGKPDTAKEKRSRDQDAKDFHVYFNRNAFSETVIDDSDMARAAASGVAIPTSARGTATTL